MSRMWAAAIFACVLSATVLAAPAQTLWAWSLPAHIPQPRIPDDNPMTPARVELGRHLFYDKRLSGNGTLACASCHQQERAFSDGRAQSLGSTGEATPRNTPGLANVVWNASFGWANPALVSLERQMEVPLFGVDPVEMGINDANRALILARLAADAVYPPLFAQAFPDEKQPFSMASVIRAIAAFERSIVAFDSRYDRYLQGTLTLTREEERGMALFFGERAECHHCHGSFNLNDHVVHARSRQVDMPFHNTGLYNLDAQGSYPPPNRGVFESSGVERDMGAFRAPSLRNVAVTAPYFHDGSALHLRDVLKAYSEGGRVIVEGANVGDGRKNPHKSDLITALTLSEQEIEDLLAFLNTLTDETLLKNPRYQDPWTRH